jgi:hypothetical protein
LPDGRFSGQITQNRPEKIGGRTATNFSEKWLKTGREKII